MDHNGDADVGDNCAEDESLQLRGDEPVSELYIWGSK